MFGIKEINHQFFKPPRIFKSIFNSWYNPNELQYIINVSVIAKLAKFIKICNFMRLFVSNKETSKSILNRND